MFALLGMSLLKDRMGYCDIVKKYGVPKNKVTFILLKYFKKKAKKSPAFPLGPGIF